MNIKQVTDADIGIIVGRFQAHELREGHLELFNEVKNRHKRVIVFLGLSLLRNTLNNPLDFRSRQKMINECFPDFEIHYIKDVRGDVLWSKNLDEQIQQFIPPGQKPLLYGSRDSFIRRYHGKFPTCELEARVFASATQIRKEVSTFYIPTKDYRAGVIAATANRFPTAYQTVDIAILDEKGNVLLAKKPNENLWRFVGGFSDPRSDSLEEDAKRETMEETGVEVDEIKYIGSIKIKDWRYEGEVDCIKTAFFVAKYIFGTPQGKDDIEKAQWFSLENLTEDVIMEEHRPLLHKLIQYLRERN